MSFTIHRAGEAVLCTGDVPRLARHSAHAFTICVAGEGSEVLVRFPFDPRWHACAAAVIAPDVAHELDGRGSACTLFLGPETHDGRRFTRASMLLHSAPPLPPAGASRLLARATVDAMVDQYATARLPRLLDPRIRQALRLLRDAGGRRLALPELAAAVALSPSRLAHLFQEQTRTTVKRSALWYRLLSAVTAMNGRSSLTEIAYRVGFADPAHLSRTCRAMLGISPSDLMRRLASCHNDSISVHDDDRSVQFAAARRP
jgi:AraC family transcriptional regulator